MLSPSLIAHTQIFQKSKAHLKILGTKTVSHMKQVPSEVRSHKYAVLWYKILFLCSLVSGICAPLTLIIFWDLLLDILDQDSVVSIMTRLQAGWQRNCGLILSRRKSFSVLQCTKTGCEAHPASCWLGISGSPSGVKQPGHKAAHLRPPCAKFRNERRCISFFPCLHGMHGDNFTFTFYLLFHVWTFCLPKAKLLRSKS
jgi:hypothetical protein